MPIRLLEKKMMIYLQTMKTSLNQLAAKLIPSKSKKIRTQIKKSLQQLKFKDHLKLVITLIFLVLNQTSQKASLLA